jgi:hypothetical protein
MWGAINSDVPNLGAEWGAKTCDPHSATARTTHQELLNAGKFLNDEGNVRFMLEG